MKKCFLFLFCFCVFCSFCSLSFSEDMAREYTPCRTEEKAVSRTPRETFLANPVPPGEEEADIAKSRETILIVPSREMKAILDIEGEGLFIPFAEYTHLYEKAKLEYIKNKNAEKIPDDVKGPVIVQANYYGSIEGDVLKFSADYDIVQNAQGPESLNFPLQGVSFLQATLEGRKVLVYEQDQAPRIIIPGPGSFNLKIDFFVPIKYKDKIGHLSFDIPQALLGNIVITADLFYDIRFRNLLFSSKKPADEKVMFFGFIGSAETVSLDITNRRSAGEEDVKIISREEHRAFLNQDLIEQTVDYHLDVQNGEIPGVNITIDKNIHVHDISGPGLSGWTREEAGTHDILHLNFHVPISGKTDFSLKTYQYLTAEADKFLLTDMQVEDLFERQGTLSVYYDENVRVDTQSVRYLQPVIGYPEDQNVPDRFTLYRQCRLFNLPYEMTLSREEMPDQIAVSQNNQMQLDQTKLYFQSEIILSGLAQGTTRLAFEYPENYTLNEFHAFVNGQAVQEDHNLKDSLLTVDVRHPISPKDVITMLIHSEELINENSFKKGSQTISIPVITYPQTAKMTGRLQISIHEMFLLEDIILKGYAPAQDIFVPDSNQEENKNLFYHFKSLSPEGKILLSARKAEQTSKTVTYVAVDEDLFQGNVYLQYHINAGKKDNFYFAIPRWEESKINIQGDHIKEKKKIGPARIQDIIPAARLSELRNYDIWNVVLQKEVIGDYFLEIDYQKKIKQFGTLFDMPLIVPLDVVNDTGYVVLEASKNTAINTEKKGLNDIETYEIPKWPSYKPSNRIIESVRYFTRPFMFKIAVKRMDESPVLASIAEKESLSYTFGKDSQVFFECDYIIRNTNLQFLKIQLPEDFIFWGATLKGKGIKPRKGPDNLLFIPLPAESGQNLSLRLTGQISRKGRQSLWESFHLQSPKLNIPCLESQVAIYFPQEYSLLHIKGNFEKFPEPSYQQPVLVSFLRNVFSPLLKNLGMLFFPSYIKRGVQGRLKSAADDIGEQFSPGTQMLQSRIRDAGQYMVQQEGDPNLGQSVQYEPYYLETDYDVQRSEMTTVTQNALMEEEEKEEHPEPAFAATKDYHKKKGILSLNIDIPKEGEYLFLHKLWGDSRLNVTFISDVWKKVLSLFFMCFFVFLGFSLREKRILSPNMFLLLTLVLCTFIPLLFFKSYVFIFNGAVLGAVMFIVILSFTAKFKKFLKKCGVIIIAVFVLLPLGTVLSEKPASAEQLSDERSSPSRCPVQDHFSEEQEEVLFPDVRVYVPYNDKKTLPPDKSGKVYVPTQDYFRLKLLAEPPYKPEDDFQYKNPFDITGLSCHGILEGDRVVFSASLDIFVNNHEWALIGLPFHHIVVEEFKADGESVPVKIKQISSEGMQNNLQKSCLIPPKKLDIYEIPVYGFGYHSVDLTFYVELKSLLGKKTLSFGFPETLFADFSLNLNGQEVFLEFEEPGESFYVDESSGSPILKASLSGKSEVRISWFPKKYLKKTEKPLIYADSEIDMLLGYDEIIISQETKIRVEKSSLASLSFYKDPDVVVIDVFSDKVKNWQVREEDGHDILDVIFKHEVTDAADLLIKAKRNCLPEMAAPAIFFRPLDAKRIHGHLNLFAPKDYKAVVTKSRNLNVAAIKEGRPREISGFQLQKSFSFLGGDFSAEIERRPEERKIMADISSQHILSEDRSVSRYNIAIDVLKNSLTALNIRLPEGQKINSVKADNTSDYILKDNVVTLPLKSAVKGRFSVELETEQDIDEFHSALIESIDLLDIPKITGTAVILFPRGFEVMESDIQGLRSSNIESVFERVPQVRDMSFGAKYAYTLREKHYKAIYNISKKEASLDVIKIYHSTVKDNLVNVQLLCIFNIKNAPVDHFDIIAPAELRDSIKVEGEGLKTVLKKETDEGKHVVLTVNTLTPIDHSYMLQVSFNKYFGSDKIFEMPSIIFPQVANRTEFVSVEADTVYHVKPLTVQSLHETEPDMIPALPEGIDLNNILWSYRASGASAWAYSLKLVRLEREKLVKAKILREDIKTLIIPNGYALHEIMLKVNNRSLQFLPVTLPREASLWSLKVAGEPVRASVNTSGEKNGAAQYLIPLIKSGSGDRNFDIMIVYITPIKEFGLFGHVKLDMMATGDVPIEKTTWSLFVPDNYSVFKFNTNMEEIDLSMIEAEKTLDLAKEYKYWTHFASTAKGELKEKALGNRERVMSDYTKQQALSQRMQTDLNVREGNKNYNQALIQEAKSQNSQILNEASNIIALNKPDSKIMNGKKQQPAKQALANRRQVKGWQFKTNDFAGEEQVERSITNYLQQEDRKKMAQHKRAEQRTRMMKREEVYGGRDKVSTEVHDQLVLMQGQNLSDSSVAATNENVILNGDMRQADYEQSLRIREKGRRVPERGSQVSQWSSASALGSQTEPVFGYKQPAPLPESSGVSSRGTGAYRETPLESGRQDSMEYWGDALDEKTESEAKPFIQIFQGKAPVQKKSALLKGRRSIDIPIPEEGRRFSFKKLGGNPTLSLVYRKNESLSKVFLLLLCIVATAGIWNVRTVPWPSDRVRMMVCRVKPKGWFFFIADARIVRIATYTLMLFAVIFRSPLFFITLGFTSIFLLRSISRKRYKKLGCVPQYNKKQFMKYFLSYLILISSLLSLFHLGFLVLVGISTTMNFIVAFIYGVFIFLAPGKANFGGETEPPGQDKKEL